MQRSFFLSFFIAIFITASTVSGQPAASWQKVTSAQGRFEAVFPASAVRSSKEIPTASGKAVMTAYESTFRDGTFVVSFSDYNYDISSDQNALKGVQAGFLEGSGSRLLAEAPTTFSGHQARVYRSRKEVNAEPFDFTIMVFIVGRRLYQIAVVQPAANATAPENVKFLDSFRLTS